MTPNNIKLTKVIAILSIGSFFPLTIFGGSGFTHSRDFSILEHRFENPEGVMNATTLLNRKGEEGHCTGAFISIDGYYVTSLHCIRDCLHDHDMFVQDLDLEFRLSIDSNAPFSAVQSKRVKSQTPQGLTCPNLQIKAMGIENPEIVFLGQGFVNLDENVYLIPQLSQSDYETLQTIQDDYAILKWDVPSNNAQCIQRANGTVQSGDQIWTIGFPMDGQSAAIRTEGSTSQMGQYISYGQIREDLRASDFFSTMNGLVDFINSSQMSELDEVVRVRFPFPEEMSYMDWSYDKHIGFLRLFNDDVKGFIDSVQGGGYPIPILEVIKMIHFTRDLNEVKQMALHRRLRHDGIEKISDFFSTAATEIIVSDTDAHYRNSGSPQVNSNGKLVAVLFGSAVEPLSLRKTITKDFFCVDDLGITTKRSRVDIFTYLWDSDTRYWAGSTLSVSVQSIYDVMLKKLGARKAVKIFNCP